MSKTKTISQYFPAARRGLTSMEIRAEMFRRFVSPRKRYRKLLRMAKQYNAAHPHLLAFAIFWNWNWLRHRATLEP